MPIRIRWMLAAGGIAVALTACAAVFLTRGDDRAPQAAPPPSTSAELESLAARTRARLDQVPGDWQAWAQLGMAHVQLARITADPAHHAAAQEALRRSLEVRPADANAPALTGQAALAAARHEFTAALGFARQAVGIDAYDAAAYGALADALIELGRYDEGFAAVQTMVDLHPDTGSFARASYTYELRGDLPRAKELMELARLSEAGSADIAFALQHLAELALATGDLAAAGAYVDEGLARFPGHPPLLADRAAVATARGDSAAAVADLRTVVDRLPLPAYATALGDLLTAAGDTEGARRQYALVRAGRQLAQAQGTGGDIDLIIFEAEHGDAAQAVKDARTLFAVRPSIGVQDALGWALHVLGQHREALLHADKALRLGTRDATMLFHRGMIHQALGDQDAARADLNAALQANPFFRQASAARALLAQPATAPGGTA